MASVLTESTIASFEVVRTWEGRFLERNYWKTETISTTAKTVMTVTSDLDCPPHIFRSDLGPVVLSLGTSVCLYKMGTMTKFIWWGWYKDLYMVLTHSNHPKTVTQHTDPCILLGPGKKPPEADLIRSLTLDPDERLTMYTPTGSCGRFAGLRGKDVGVKASSVWTTRPVKTDVAWKEQKLLSYNVLWKCRNITHLYQINLFFRSPNFHIIWLEVITN